MRDGVRVKDLLSIREVTARTGLSRTTLYGLMSRGELLSRNVGKRRLIPTDGFQAWLRALPPEAIH